MRNVNTILPIDINKPLVEVLDDILSYCSPSCMYTYDTARASYNDKLYVESKFSSKELYDQYASCHDMIYVIVNSLYGPDRMDNKITMKFYTPDDIPVYISWWDGKIVISNEVHIYQNTLGPNSSYRLIPFTYSFS